MNDFFISKFKRAMREGEVMANLPWPFFETEKNIPIMKKMPKSMSCFGCTVEHFVFVFILICFKAFGNLDFLDLPCGTFIFNVYKRKLLLRNFSKINGINFRQ